QRVRRQAQDHLRLGSGAPAVSWPSMHVLSASRARGEAEENNAQPVRAKGLRVLHMPLTSCRIWSNVMLSCAAISCDWLRVFSTAERAQMHQRVRQHLHASVPLMDAFNP